MPYRNQTYVALDYDTDSRKYNLMKAWKANDNIDFDFHNAHELTTIRDWSQEDSIKASLRERMANSKVFVLLIGTNTRYCHTYVKWEIELAMKKGLPIIAVNLNDSKSYDETYCPATLRGKLALHIPFSPGIMAYALDNWPAWHDKYTRSGDAEPKVFTAATYAALALA